MTFREDTRGVRGIMVLVVSLLALAVYMIAAGAVFGGLNGTPLVDPAYVGVYNGSQRFQTMARVAQVYGPLVWIAGALVFSVAWYIRRERFGGQRPPP